MVQLARDYATRRTAFGKLLKDHALHMQTLARMEVNWPIVKINIVFPMMPHSCLLLTWIGGDSRSISFGHGCMSSIGQRGKQNSDRA